MKLERTLDPVEIRVLGSLLEKEQATPDYYPMTLNALRAACNQKTNREPVMDLGDDEIERALERLQQYVFVWKRVGGRSVHWEHDLDRKWRLDAPSKAVMTLLLLRGPQTPGELRGRSDRLHRFDSTGDVEVVLQRLATGDEPLVIELPRRAGQKESRWMHLAGDGEEVEPETAPVALRGREDDIPSRLERLESRVEELSQLLDDLRRQLGG